MAWQVSKRVWDNVPSSITKNERLMLLALAEHADEAGVCWPGYDVLASMVGVDERTAMRLIQHLEREKQIINFKQAGQRGGRGHTNLYLIITGLSQTEIEEIVTTHPIFIKKGDKIYALYEKKKGDILGQKGDIFGQKGDIFGQKGDTAMSPEPCNHGTIMNHQRAAKPPAHPKPEIIPAFKIFVEVIGKSHLLNKVQIKSIDQVVGRDPPNLERWRDAVVAWNLNGNKPNDAAGMLDWFKTGKRSNYSPKNGETNGTYQQQLKATGVDLGREATFDPYTGQTIPVVID